MTTLQNPPKDSYIEFDIDVRDPLIAEVSEWRGYRKIAIRHWFELPQEKGTFARTRKGIEIPVDELDHLIEGLMVLREEINDGDQH